MIGESGLSKLLWEEYSRRDYSLLTGIIAIAVVLVSRRKKFPLQHKRILIIVEKKGAV